MTSPEPSASATPATGEEPATSIGDVDGRTMRRRRNRAAVIRALIDLVREGDLNPTVAKIADRAQVSHRSIFRYFDDLEDLAHTAIATEFATTLPDLAVADVGDGTLDERIARLVDTRLPVYQRTHRLYLVARSKMLTIDEVGRQLVMGAAMQRQQIRRHFDVELAAITERGGDAEAVALGASIIVSYDAYEQLVTFDQLSTSEIRTTWIAALTELLASP